MGKVDTIVSLRLDPITVERLERSRGELTLGQAIKKIIKHNVDAGEGYLRNITGQEKYYQNMEMYATYG